MVTKRDLELVIGAYGLGRILPRGSTRAAVRKVVGTIVRGGRVVIPPVARAATATPAGRVAALGLGAGAAYRAGVFDPVEDAINREVERRVGGIQQTLGNLEMAVDLAQTPRGQETLVKVTKRKVSNFNKAMKAGMAAVKRSKSNGKPGTMRSPKATFARIAKVAKAMKSGKKVSSKGETGVIKRSIKRYIG